MIELRSIQLLTLHLILTNIHSVIGGINKREIPRIEDSTDLFELEDGVFTIPSKSYSGHIHDDPLLIEESPGFKIIDENGHEFNKRKRRDLNEEYLEQLMMTPEEWIADAVLWHNKLRARHGANPLELDYKLCFEAEEFAINLAEQSEYAGELVLKHDPDLAFGTGQSVAARAIGSRTSLMELPGGFVVQNWYKEIQFHNWKTNFYQTNNGQFTQLIWGATKSVGCGRTVSQNSILIVVCHYVPPGNYFYKSAYKTHVKPPIDGKMNSVPDFSKM